MPEYRALQLLAEQKDKEDLFNPRITRVLIAFLSLIEEFRASSREISLVKLFDLVTKRTGYQEYIINRIGGEERWDNILELRAVAQEYKALELPDGLAAFLEGVTLVGDVDGLDDLLR